MIDTKLDGPKLLVALDYENEKDCLSLVSQLEPSHCRLKVGKELFTCCGPSIVEKLQYQGFEIFLDLKFHDIPNTVAKAVSAAANLGVWMVNVHASGGAKMLDAAVNALGHFKSRPLLIGVTVLTSIDKLQLEEIGLDVEPHLQVKRLANIVKCAGADGVVSSAREVSMLKAEYGHDFLCVTPGIRPATTHCDDQVRVMTPLEAVQMGSDFLVVGRPITMAKDPAGVCDSIYKQIN